MKKIIEKLSPEQEALLTVYRDKWMAIGLSTKPADRPRAEAAIRTLYADIGLTAPKQIIWTTSPLAGAIVASILKDDDLIKKICADTKLIGQVSPAARTRTSVGDRVRDSVRGSMKYRVWNSVGDSVEYIVEARVLASMRTSVGDRVRDAVWNSVGGSVEDTVEARVLDGVGGIVEASVRYGVWESVWNSVRDRLEARALDGTWDRVWSSVECSVESHVRDRVWDRMWERVGQTVIDSVRDRVVTLVGDALYMQHDAGYCGFIDYMRNVCGLVEQTQKMVAYMDLAQSANWIYPYRNICIVSDRPDIVALKNGRIHSDIGPAIRYRDGFSVYGLNGVRVQEWIVETPADAMDPARVLALTNVEERLQAIKKMGAHKIIKELNGRSISRKGDEYELFEITLEGSKEKLLRMKNPSEDKMHYEFVAPEIKTVDQALAWRIGWDTFKEPLAKT